MSALVQAVNPSTGEAGDVIPFASADQVEAALDRSTQALVRWRGRSMDERAAVMRRLGELVEAAADKGAALMAAEMGKPVAQGLGEMRKCRTVCDHYAQMAAAYLSPVALPSDREDATVRYEPLGLILAIMPWNFPVWQAYRFAVPAWMAGNGVILKHAPSVPGCAQLVYDLAIEAGVPTGVVELLHLRNDQVAEVIGDRRVGGVTFTGSTAAGRKVAAVCGRHLKPSVLELGGSDAFVVLSDADVQQASKTAIYARLQNTGQSCIAAKRFIVSAQVADAFVAHLKEGLLDQRQGDPLDPSVTVGPMAREDLAQAIHKQVQDAIAKGAECVMGGEWTSGCHYPVTLLLGLLPSMMAWDGELFGPVAAVTVASDDAHAIELANQSRFGLAASVWTQHKGEWAVNALSSGAVFLNAMSRSDPRWPFGGVRDSGWGRELGRDGILAFCNRKTVVLDGV